MQFGGIGKSWTLQNLGSEVVRQGKTVVHYSLELNENYVGLRYDSIFSGVTTEKQYKVSQGRGTETNIKTTW